MGRLNRRRRGCWYKSGVPLKPKYRRKIIIFFLNVFSDTGTVIANGRLLANTHRMNSVDSQSEVTRTASHRLDMWSHRWVDYPCPAVNDSTMNSHLRNTHKPTMAAVAAEENWFLALRWVGALIRHYPNSSKRHRHLSNQIECLLITFTELPPKCSVHNSPVMVLKSQSSGSISYFAL